MEEENPDFVLLVAELVRELVGENRVDHHEEGVGVACRKRRLNGTVLQMRPEKPRSHVTAGAEI